MKLLRLFIIALLFVSACTAEPIKYYTLPDSIYLPPAHIKSPVAVQVVMADYLAAAPIIYSKNSDTAVELTTRHLWAGNLHDAVRNVLTNELNRLNSARGRTFVIEYADSLPQLIIHIARFQGNGNGTATVAGYVDYVDTKAKLRHSFPVAAVVKQQEPGYAGLTLALSRTLKVIAKDISVHNLRSCNDCNSGN